MTAVVIHARICLLDEVTPRRPVPDPAPRLICPAQTERKIRLPRREHFVEGALEDATASEPVVVVAEALDAMVTGKLGLRRSRFRQSQVVEAKVRGNVRLIKASKQRLCSRGVGPFREALTPPGVVLR